jgi:8-oxo-dGTP pyrophosphatase MutT (NUDIX family)
MAGSTGIVFRNNNKEILLVKRRDIPIWVLPGGGVEKDETPEQAVIREVKEETGFNVAVERKVGEYKHPKSEKVNNTFTCTIQSGEATLSVESKAIKYFEITNLPQMLSPYVRDLIEDALGNKETTITRTYQPLPLFFWLKALTRPRALFKYLLTRIGVHWNT